MDNKKNKFKIGKLDSHLVIICDEEGILEAYMTFFCAFLTFPPNQLK